jgi:hypothetical protein
MSACPGQVVEVPGPEHGPPELLMTGAIAGAAVIGTASIAG